jgi:hypothetical protein
LGPFPWSARISGHRFREQQAAHIGKIGGGSIQLESLGNYMISFKFLDMKIRGQQNQLQCDRAQEVNLPPVPSGLTE